MKAEELTRLVARVRQTMPTNRELAHALDISETHVGRVLKGGYSFSVQNCLRLASLADEPPSAVLRMAGKDDVADMLDKAYATKETVAQTNVPGFVALPLLHRPIAAGEPLDTNPDPDSDETIAFAERFVKRFTRPVCLRVGKREESMLPVIQPGDVVALDQAEDKRRRPIEGRIYAVNYGPLTGEEGGALKRAELADDHLVIYSENPDKSRYPTRIFHLADKNLLDILKGEVVWLGKYLGSGKGKQ